MRKADSSLCPTMCLQTLDSMLRRRASSPLSVIPWQVKAQQQAMTGIAPQDSKRMELLPANQPRNKLLTLSPQLPARRPAMIILIRLTLPRCIPRVGTRFHHLLRSHTTSLAASASGVTRDNVSQPEHSRRHLLNSGLAENLCESQIDCCNRVRVGVVAPV